MAWWWLDLKLVTRKMFTSNLLCMIDIWIYIHLWSDTPTRMFCVRWKLYMAQNVKYFITKTSFQNFVHSNPKIWQVEIKLCACIKMYWVLIFYLYFPELNCYLNSSHIVVILLNFLFYVVSHLCHLGAL